MGAFTSFSLSSFLSFPSQHPNSSSSSSSNTTLATTYYYNDHPLIINGRNHLSCNHIPACTCRPCANTSLRQPNPSLACRRKDCRHIPDLRGPEPKPFTVRGHEKERRTPCSYSHSTPWSWHWWHLRQEPARQPSLTTHPPPSFSFPQGNKSIKTKQYVSLEIMFLLPLSPCSFFLFPFSRETRFVVTLLSPSHSDTEDTLPPTRPSFLVSRQPNVADNYIHLTF